MNHHVGYKRPETHYHPTEELHKIFILAHRITPENIELMKKWDKENGFQDRFKPHHSGFPEWRNKSLANSCEGTEEEKMGALDYLNGKISTIDYDYRIFKKAMLKGYEARKK